MQPALDLLLYNPSRLPEQTQVASEISLSQYLEMNL